MNEKNTDKEIDLEAWYTGMQKDEMDKSEGRGLILSRPVERPAPNSTQLWKLFPDPDRSNPLPFFKMFGHYIGRTLKACPGDVCKQNPGLPCFKDDSIYEAIRPLYEKKKVTGLTPKEEKFLTDQAAKRKDYRRSEYHHYYLINITPAFRGGDFVGGFKKCWGKRAQRPIDDGECMECAWQRSCSDGLKIWQARYVRNTQGGKISNGEKLAMVLRDKKRLAAVFAGAIAEDGFIHTKAIRVERVGAGKTSDYQIGTSDEDVLIPAFVKKIVLDQMMPLSAAVMPHLTCPPKELAALIAQKEAAASFDFVAPGSETVARAISEKQVPEVEKRSVENDYESVKQAKPLTEHPLEAVRKLAEKAQEKVAVEQGEAKPMTSDQIDARLSAEGHKKRPRCFGKPEFFARGQDACAMCEQRHEWLVSQCEIKVQAMLDVMGTETD